ncbi:MAG: histidine kinase, partial [Burkholderiaceae bacterium]
ATLVHLFRHGLGWIRWEVRKKLGLPAKAPVDWPGWPLMVVALVLATAIGYSLGVEIANFLTGFQEKGLFNSSARRVISVIVMSLIPGFGLTFFFLSRHRLIEAEARAETLRRQAAETQLRLLESQLEPHMLFNTLANLRVLIGMDTQRAQTMLDHLIAFLRGTLSASRADKHPLQDEFARLADYLALMQVRMGSRLRFEFDLPAEAGPLAVPPLLLQPLVENAIKHGLEAHVGGGLLSISARLEKDQLVLEVADNGSGLQPAMPVAAEPSASAQGGFGTVQVRERLAVAYGDGAALEVLPREGGGTLSRVRIPRRALVAATAAPSAACGS